METGYAIKENVIVTRVAEGAIAFASGAMYAPVIEGTSSNQAAPATAAAITVTGFVKRPTTKDSIADGDTVDVVIDGVIQMPVAAAVTINDFLVVDATVTQLALIDPDTSTAITLLAELRQICAKAVHGGSGNVYVKIGGV